MSRNVNSDCLISPNHSKVLVIGWDAADWRAIRPLLEQGKMPHLQRMMEEGCHGNVSTLNPILSPMLWTSIATGKRPSKHGIWGFSEPSPDGKTIRPITNRNRRCKAIWNILSQVDKKCNVVGYWPSHPAEPINGVMVSNWYHRAIPIKGWTPTSIADRPKPGLQGWTQDEWPMPEGTVHPEHLSEKLMEFRMHPSELEAAHIGPFIPNFLELQEKEDPRLVACSKVLADATSVHAATTALMSLEPWDFTAVYYDAIDHFGHGFMKYHPPRNPWIPEADFENFKHVVESGYRLHDLFLGTLLQLAGEDTTVILLSDHGFHPDHLRPSAIPAIPAGPAVEHRTYGIFVAKGPGIRRNTELTGASVLDLTPTVLQIFGLPVGSDMDGKVLANLFDQPTIPTTVPSWDDIEGPKPAGMHLIEDEPDNQQDAEMMKQLVELGYIEAPDEDHNEAKKQCLGELHYNLAESHIDAGEYWDAYSLLDTLWADSPRDHRYGLNLIRCLAALERWPEHAKAIDLLEKNVEETMQWAQESLDELKPELKEFGLIEDKDNAEAKSEATVNTKEEEKPRHPAERRRRAEKKKKLEATLRKLQWSLAPMDLAIQWLRIEHRLATDDLSGIQTDIESFEKHTESQSNVPMYNMLAFAHLKLKNYPKAEIYFRKLLELDSENAIAERGLAEIAFVKEDWEEAVERSLSAIDLQFNDAHSHFLLAKALAQCDEPELARPAFESAIHLRPDLTDYSEAYIQLLDTQGDSTAAEQERQRITEIREKLRQASDVDLIAQQEMAEQTARRQDLGLFVSAPQAKATTTGDNAITIVSGLPRSGTSMMMQMLVAGGLKAVTDKGREADEDNPHGYFEDKRVMGLMRDNDWIPSAHGQALKVVAPLLKHLPSGSHYNILFMDRDLRAVVKSQRTMLQRNNRDGARLPDYRLMHEYRQQLVEIEQLIATREDMTVLFLNYDRTVSTPRETSKQIGQWLPMQLDQERMAAAVDPSLQRQRPETAENVS